MHNITIILTILILSATCIVKGQANIENRNFEKWALDADYYEPTNNECEADYWGTTNPISKLGPLAPKTVFVETKKVYEGKYAARITSSKLGTLPIAGTLATGVFRADPNDPIASLKFGQPFNDRPARFQGYYQYFPQEEDACAIEILFTKYNSSTEQRDTIARTYFSTFETIDTYTLFDLRIQYFSAEDPDSINLIITPSYKGDLFIAGDCSTLYIDALNLKYDNSDGINGGDDTTCNISIPESGDGIDCSGTSVQTIDEINLSVFPNPAQDFLHIESTQAMDQIIIYNLQGRLVQKTPLQALYNTIDIQSLQTGNYLYQILKKEQVIKKGSFEIFE